MLENGEIAGLTPRERAMAEYAERLTVAPAKVAREDVDALRGAGLSDREILDVAQTAAYFAYVNRLALGLGAELEGDEDALGKTPGNP